jgi:hypothetical protein
MDKGGVKIIDSMPLLVCSNKRMFGYKVSELAARVNQVWVGSMVLKYI